MNIEELYQIFLQHPQVITDSRKIIPGSIFFALKGENFNGNEFAASAILQGAAYAVVDEIEFHTDVRILLVDNTLQALQSLARFHRQKLNLPILAITGTNGKTTTKELIAYVLSTRFKVVYTKGNLNNHIGVPLTLLSMQSDTEFAVIEMGANHPGEIAALCQIALPDFGIITNVGKAHLEGFGSFEGVINTKTELYRFLEQKEGTIFVNSANEILMQHLGKTKTVTYTTNPIKDGLQGEIVSTTPYITIKVLFPKGWLYIKSQLVGSYNLENILAASCAGLYFKIDPTMIADAIANYTPENHRSQLIHTAENQILMDAYNANPSSMNAALDNFMLLESPKKGIIIGDMLELGNVAEEEHQKIIDKVIEMKLAKIILIGSNFGKCTRPDSVQHFDRTDEALTYIRQIKLKNYLLLIKGSRGMKLETLVPEL